MLPVSPRNEDGDKVLCKIPQKRLIGGVCAGLGWYMGISPTILRVIFAIVGFFWGAGLVAYLICWAIFPKAKEVPEDWKER